jgi:hypothetical protein
VRLDQYDNRKEGLRHYFASLGPTSTARHAALPQKIDPVEKKNGPGGRRRFHAALFEKTEKIRQDIRTAFLQTARLSPEVIAEIACN